MKTVLNVKDDKRSLRKIQIRDKGTIDYRMSKTGDSNPIPQRPKPRQNEYGGRFPQVVF